MRGLIEFTPEYSTAAKFIYGDNKTMMPYPYADDYTEFILDKILCTRNIPESRKALLQEFINFANNMLCDLSFQKQMPQAEVIHNYNNFKSMAWLRQVAYGQFHVDAGKRHHNWRKRRKMICKGKWGRK